MTINPVSNFQNIHILFHIEILDLLDGYYWWFIHVYSKMKTSVAEINENEKVVSGGNQLLG